MDNSKFSDESAQPGSKIQSKQVAESEQNAHPIGSKISVATKVKLVGFLVWLLAMFGIWWFFGDQLRLSGLAKWNEVFAEYRRDHFILTLTTAFAIYVVVTALSIPGGATGLTLLYGWLFGFFNALFVVSFASAIGATLAFLASRYLLQDWVRKRFTTRVVNIESLFEKEGIFYLLTLRLVPLVPFFLVNLAMGLTPIRTRTYYWVSQLAMLPATAVYVYAGSTVPDLAELAEQGIRAVFSVEQVIQFTVAFALIGSLPLIAKWTIGHLRQRSR